MNWYMIKCIEKSGPRLTGRVTSVSRRAGHGQRWQAVELATFFRFIPSMVPPLPASHLLAGRHVAVRSQAILLRRYASIGRPLSAGRGYTSQAPNHPPKTPENPPRGASQTTPFQRTQQGPAKDGEEETPVENNFFTNMFPFLAGRSGAFDTAMSAIVGLGMRTLHICLFQTSLSAKG